MVLIRDITRTPDPVRFYWELILRGSVRNIYCGPNGGCYILAKITC